LQNIEIFNAFTNLVVTEVTVALILNFSTM